MLALTALVFSCDKHEIEFNEKPVGKNMAEVRLIYAIPEGTVTPSSSKPNTSNQINRLLYNGQLYSNVATNPGGCLPSSLRYHVVPAGDNVMEFQSNPYGDTEAVIEPSLYKQTVNFKAGKQTCFVYNFNRPPVVVDEGFPYPNKDEWQWRDTVCLIRFVNVFHKQDGVTPYGKLRLYARYGTAKTGYSYAPVGPAVAFGEATEWEPVKIDAGGDLYGRRYVPFLIKEVNADGSEPDGFLQTYDSKGNASDYVYSSIYCQKGRVAWMYMSGKKGTDNKSQFLRLDYYFAK